MLRTAALASVLALSATVALARTERPKRPSAQPAPKAEVIASDDDASTQAPCVAGEECRPTIRHDALSR